MGQSSNVIAFPKVSAGERVRRHEASPATTPTVIDLVTHRYSSVESPALAGEKFTCTLTAGEIWEALEDDRLVVHYQPQYDMCTGEMVAAEALVRLIDRDGHLIYPDHFIDQVERSDLIVGLGRAVIERACADLAACHAEGLAIQRIAINLSSHQLNIDTCLLRFIDQVVARYQLDYGNLEFELTERQNLTPHCEGIRVLHALAQRGARIVIDDFGIGYSSIMYLAELPVSAFKLDRALVGRLHEGEPIQNLVRSLLSLATSMNLEVVAEGIETDAQKECLLRAGCDYAQGFGYAEPMSICELQSFMDKSYAIPSYPGEQDGF